MAARSFGCRSTLRLCTHRRALCCSTSCAATSEVAVVREDLLNRSVKQRKVYDSSNEFLNSLCLCLYPQYQELLRANRPETALIIGNMCMDRFNAEMVATALRGWRWNASDLKYTRRGNSTGLVVQQADRAAQTAELAEQQRRKRALEKVDAELTARHLPTSPASLSPSQLGQVKKPRNALPAWQ